MGKLILFPLACIVLLSFLSMTGLGDSVIGHLTFSGDPSETLYYDSGGHGLVYANGTVFGESGIVSDSIVYGAVWDNGSIVVYEMFWDQYGLEPLEFEDYGQAEPSITGVDLDVLDSFGLLALIVGVMAVGVIAGLRVLGTGVSDVSVATIIFGTAYLAVWAVFSVLSLGLLDLANNMIVSLIYFTLSIMYAVGVVQQINGAGLD